MSPFSMAGTKPLYRCRSEPQIAVDVTRTIASFILMISGSGTFSTRISFFPYQQVAFIKNPIVLSLFAFGVEAVARCCRLLMLMLNHQVNLAGTVSGPAGRLAIGAHHFAGFHKLFEPAQIN